MARILISWQQYQQLAKSIFNALVKDNYKPDLIVGIARGGLMPMVTISGYYKTRKVGVIFMQKTATDGEYSEMLPEAICHGYGLPFSVADQNVLLVDNIVQSGQTVWQAINMITTLGAKSSRVVSICKHRGTYKFTHYAPLEVKEDDWVVFPWDQLI